jgi:deoxycytidylate deaminase
MRPDWDSYFLEISRVVAARATCPRKHVGAVVVSPDHQILSTGYNGSPPGADHCDDVGCELKDMGGRQSCVPASTVISKFQTGHYNSRHRTVGYIHGMWNEPLRGRLHEMKIRAVASNGVIVPGLITDIWKVGKRPIVEITTWLGRKVRCTEDQLLLTLEGWCQAASLNGSSVALNGVSIVDDPSWLKSRYEKENLTVDAISTLAGVHRSVVQRRLVKFNIPRRPKPDWSCGGGPGAGWNRGKTHGGSATYKGRNVRASSARSRARRYALADDCVICASVENLQVHHIDGDHLNDDLDNLTTLCVRCHNLAHTPHAKRERIIFDRVVSIESAGVEEVFDLSTSPHHNFIGDGFVLHNCVRTIHAEANAIAQAARNGVRIAGATIYTTASPCYDCGKLIANSGIKKVVFGEKYDSRYGMSGDVMGFLIKCGVVVAGFEIKWRIDGQSNPKPLLSECERLGCTALQHNDKCSKWVLPL